MGKKLINETNIPQHVIEAAARCLLQEIRAFYESEEGQKEFRRWKAEQDTAKKQREDEIR